jgi:hypothetical protein
MVSKLKSILGYTIAALMVPVVMVTLLAMGPLAQGLVDATGVVISPIYTGGEVVRTVTHGSYETHIHRPVFDGLLAERRTGFVQIVWSPLTALPETLVEDIDYNNDGKPDFQVTLHPKTKTAEWKPFSSQAYGLEGPYAIGDGLGVRINLKNQN